MRNFLFIAFLLSGFMTLLLSGCVTSSFKPSAVQNAINIGMPENEFIKEYARFGEKIYYPEIDTSSSIWILYTDQERVWLSGNAFLGGRATTKHHMVMVIFVDSKVYSVNHSSMDAFNKKTMTASGYKTFYWLGESLESCKQYLSINDRGRYSYVIAAVINSWVHAPEVFERINHFNRQNGNLISPQGETQCNDAFAFFEKMSYEFDQSNKKNN